MTKATLIIIGAVLLLAGVAAASTLTGVVPTTESPTVSIPAGTSTSDSTTSVRTSTDGDISGPCDEAEHAADPRCTGAGAGARDDDRRDDRRDNSGPGSSSSGPGRGGSDDDSSGRGHGGGDDDNSGSGDSGSGNSGSGGDSDD